MFRILHEITEPFEAVSFEIAQGDGVLMLGDPEHPPEPRLKFRRLRWHQFTALYNCGPDMIREAYQRLIEYPDSREVATYISQDRAAVKAYKELHHYRVFIDEHGCHDIYAESVSPA